jgi:2-keto-4-pentenoate hydratase/2-oxohepta-3-ene-1,7-dioic acid hydratase in catechol pathway
VLVNGRFADIRKALTFCSHLSFSTQLDPSKLSTILSAPKVIAQVIDFLRSNDEVLESCGIDLQRSKMAPPVRPGKCFAVGGITTRRKPNPISYVKPMLKSGEAAVGDNELILIPRGIGKIHSSVELCVVIGERCRNLPLNQVRHAIAGYTVGNDIAALDLYKLHGDLASTSKSLETFAPIGPILVTPDEIDTENLELTLRINGVMKARGFTCDSVFTPERIVSDISSLFTLNPGDVIFCGNIGEQPIVSIGEMIEASIQGIGVLHNTLAQTAGGVAQSYEFGLEHR